MKAARITLFICILAVVYGCGVSLPEIETKIKTQPTQAIEDLFTIKAKLDPQSGHCLEKKKADFLLGKAYLSLFLQRKDNPSNLKASLNYLNAAQERNCPEKEEAELNQEIGSHILDVLLVASIQSDEVDKVIANVIKITKVVEERQQCPNQMQIPYDLSRDMLGNAAVLIDLIKRGECPEEIRAQNQCNNMETLAGNLRKVGMYLFEIYSTTCDQKLEHAPLSAVRLYHMFAGDLLDCGPSCNLADLLDPANRNLYVYLALVEPVVKSRSDKYLVLADRDKIFAFQPGSAVVPVKDIHSFIFGKIIGQVTYTEGGVSLNIPLIVDMKATVNYE